MVFCGLRSQKHTEQTQISAFDSELMSATTAFIAPLIMPPKIPIKKIEIPSKDKEWVNAIPSKPMKNQGMKSPTTIYIQTGLQWVQNYRTYKYSYW